MKLNIKHELIDVNLSKNNNLTHYLGILSITIPCNEGSGILCPSHSSCTL